MSFNTICDYGREFLTCVCFYANLEVTYIEMKKYPISKDNKFFGVVKKVLSYITTGLKKFDALICSPIQSFIFIIGMSFVVNIFLEAALRKSFIDAFALCIKSPVMFALNFLIVLASYSLIYFFRKRTFSFSLISILWITIISISYYMMCKRTTPFTSSDLRVIKTTFEIIPLYLTTFQIVLLCVGIVAIFALLVLIYIKSGKTPHRFSLSSYFPIQVWAITIVSVLLYSNFALASDRFDNLPNKYKEHGFAYCFFYSLLDNGIDKPHNYSKESYKDIKETIKNVETTGEAPELVKNDSTNPLLNSIHRMVIDGYNDLPNYLCYNFDEQQALATTSHIETQFNKYVEASNNLSSGKDNPADGKFPEDFDMPNIIFLQLESFYDVTNIEGYEYSKEPHPIYSYLKENLPGGLLTVPSIGAGTANTEFETIAGMDVSLFGIAEYPYLSVLQTQTCESMAYNAKAYGYTTHAIHNHKGTFYDRNKVFPHLGFDTFTSIENMPNIVRNQRKWAKDSMLIAPIMESLKSTPGKDLIYSISVQPHGRYPSESTYEKHLMGQDPRIVVTGNEHNPENPSFTYYVNQIFEADLFLGNLILELSLIDEPTVLVFYGDHLPAFSVQKYWRLKEGDCYQTDYIIWNNCGIDFTDAKDLSTYQLASYIFSKTGIDTGEANLLNRIYLGETDPVKLEEYKNKRQTLQYAIFMDKQFKNGTAEIQVPDYPESDIRYGIFQTEINGIYTIEDKTYITGSNFNEFTKVSVNGNVVDTEVLDIETLYITSNLEEGDIISTFQVATNHAILGECINEITYTSDMIVNENMREEVLDMIIPVIEDEKETQGISDSEEDATADFITGQDEMNMRQEDISK